MTAPPALRGFLVTFKPCGHVQHYNGEPRPGTWASCNYMPHRKGCQSQRQVQAVERCPGCPECPRWKPSAADWQQPSLFDGLEAAA